MVEFAGQDPVTAPVSREKNHVAPAEFAGQKIIRRRAEGRFDFDPFLVGKAVDVIETCATDYAYAMFSHADFVTAKRTNGTKKMLNCPDLTGLAQ
jgi:hypothetical protein